MQPPDDLIISVQVARKIIGCSEFEMSDDEIEQLIRNFDDLVKAYIDDSKKRSIDAMMFGDTGVA